MRESTSDGAQAPTLPSSFDDAFAALFRRAREVAIRIVRNSAEADDIAMETMVRSLIHWDRIETSYVGWVTRVACRLAIDVVRKQRRTRLEPSEIIDLQSDTEVVRVDIVRAVAELPRRQREAVTLCYLLDMSTAEAALILGCSVGSIKQHTSRARAHLKFRLDNGDGQ